MSDKKFSDFTSVNVLQDNEFLATELLGVENRKITFNDFATQIQNRLLPLSFNDFGHIKSSLIAPSDNKQPNMIYCDGTTYYASNPNQLISKFINAVYQYEALRNFLQIPADKSSFKTPDLRNQHLVGVGSGNTAYQFITSKVMNFISNVSTSTSVATNITINNGGDHNHLMLSNEIGIERPTGATFVSVQGDFSIFDYVMTKGVANPTLGKTSNAGTHNHTGSASSTATSTTNLTYNNSLIDTINRVPALAVYHYIDIAVDRFNLDPNTGGGVAITIGDVVGLQTALDLKADITLLNDYATISALNLGLEGKADINHTHIIDNITGLQTALDGKATIIHNHLIGDLKYDASTSLENWLALTYAPISHTHNISGINGLQTALDGKANITDIIRPALVSIPVLSTTIANGSIVNLNLGTPVLLSGDGVVGDYVSVVNNLVKTKNTTNRVMSFGAGILANYSTQNQNRNYRFMARRPAVVSVAGTNPNDILNDDIDVKLGTGDIADCEFNFASTFSNGVDDPFNIDGFVFSIDNISGTSITTIQSRTGYAKQSYIRIEFK